MCDVRTPKRPKVSEDVRFRRISELQEDIQDATDQIKIKEKRRTLATASHQYKDCDSLTSQISLLRCKLREHKTELAQLQKKQRKSTWYTGRKNRGDKPELAFPIPSSSSVHSGSTSDVQSSAQPPSPVMSPKVHSGQVSLSAQSTLTYSSSLASPPIGSTNSQVSLSAQRTLTSSSSLASPPIGSTDSEPERVYKQ